MLNYSENLTTRAPIELVLSAMMSLCVACGAFAQSLDDTWTVSVNGQTVRVNGDGTFIIPNVPAPDLFGLDGPGTAPDFLSDDFVRVVGYSTEGGTTRWVYSPLFQFSQGESFNVEDLTFTNQPPPFPESIRMTSGTDTLQVGQSTQLNVNGLLIDGSLIDLTARSSGTVYRTSDPSRLTVSADGLAVGVRRGTVFVTAVNSNMTATKRIDLFSPLVSTTIEGFVQLPDQSPVDGAQVSLAEFGGEATTDATGRFVMQANVAEGALLRLAVNAQVDSVAYLGSLEGLPAFIDGITDAGIITVQPGFTGVVPDTYFDNPEYAVGSIPDSVFFADLNGDDTLDAVVANRNEGTVSVLLNAGVGVFTEPVDYDVAVNPVSVAIADLDGDNDQDLAVACGSAFSSDPGFVTVLVNLGNGTFASDPAQYPTADGAIDIVAGDLDGDQFIDIATANRAPSSNIGTISILFNNGDGSLAEQVAFNVGNEPHSLGIGDFDGDGDLDLAAAMFLDNNVTILLNDGNGNLLTGALLDLAGRPSSLVVDDLSGSAALDIAVGIDLNPGRVELFVGNGKGAFATPVALETGRDPEWVESGDIDGDGNIDLATANNQSGDVSILFGNGDGTFAEHVLAPAGEKPSGIAFGDLDGDEEMDFACVNGRSDGRAAFVHNNGDRTFGPIEFATGFRNINGCGDNSVVVRDLNGDTLLDSVVGACGGNHVAVMLRNGDGSFADAVTYNVAGKANAVAAGDFDGDTDVDVAVATGDTGRVSILLNEGDGVFAGHGDLTVTSRPRAIAAGHLNNDEHIDLATASQPSSGSDVVSVLFGNGDGTFADALPITVSNASLIAINDADGDKLNDLVVGRSGTPRLAVLLNNGDNTFAAPLEANAPQTFPTEMAVGDIDNDSDVDVVLVGSNRNVSVLLGNGDGSFVDGVRYRVGSGNHSTNCVAIGDINGDGINDVVAGNEDTHDITLLIGVGDGTLQIDRFYIAGFSPSALAMGDVDADGDLDVVVHSSPITPVGGGPASHISTLLNRLKP